jgi:predicted metal-dependent enzyme (double-stranded beta helix superfamily)
MSPTTPRFDRDGFIADIQNARPEGQRAVAEVIARAVSDPGAVARELGEPTRASIELLHREPGLSVFNLVWPPLAVMVPHDHRMWASIGVYAGREDNIMWTPAGQTIRTADAASVSTGEVFSLSADAIHSVTNPIEGYTAAIHVYGGDLAAVPRSQWNPLTLNEEPFDVEDGRRILREADERFAGRVRS